MLAQRLDSRYYTSVSDFSRDFLRAVGEILAPRLNIDDPSDADIEAIYGQLNEVQPGTAEHMALTQEQKDLKRLAKRIIKNVKQPLEDAARKEAELRGRELEEEMRKLDSMGIFASTASRSVEMDVDNDFETSIKHRSDSDVSAIAGASPGVQANDGDTEMLVADDPSNEDAMQVDAPDKHKVIPVAASRYTPVSKAASYTSSIPDHTRRTRSGAEPLSPSISRSSSGPNGAVRSVSDESTQALSDSHDVFAQGGVPWYLEPFDPMGTTIHDERYTGRAVLRDMSEELSDMDEDTLTELAGNGVEPTPNAKSAQANGASSVGSSTPASRKPSNKKKKAKKNFWSRR